MRPSGPRGKTDDDSQVWLVKGAGCDMLHQNCAVGVVLLMVACSGPSVTRLLELVAACG